MSNSRILSWLVAWVAVWSVGSTAGAQDFQPFIDPNAFNPDYQFFAPVDIDPFGGGPKPNTGWFGSYDRVYMYFSRPEREPSRTSLDNGWGNLYQFGYMTEENRGWHVSVSNIGVTFNDVIITERNERFNAAAAPQEPKIFPERDNNNRLTEARDYLVTNSINSAQFSGFELNRVIRLEQFHYGGVMEPFFGIRHAKFVDHHRRDNYFRFDATGATVPTLPPPADTTAVGERLTSANSQFHNNMVGGQLGARWAARRGRWDLTTSIRFFGLQNFQNWRRITDVETTIATVGGAVSSSRQERTTAYAHGGEFVWGGELQVQTAFEVSRDLALHVGLDMINFGQGVGRGDNPLFNSEDVTMVGVTFGLELVR